MKITKGRCSISNKFETVLIGNNPLLPPIGLSHLYSLVDVNNIEAAEYMCRTFNFPFSPEDWIKAVQLTPDRPIETYVEKYLIKFSPEHGFVTSTKNIWKQVNTEWEKAMTHVELLEKIQPIKEEFMRLSIVKWGAGYEFYEYIKLEDQFTNTISTFDINNPMQVDAVKKACIASIMIDKKMKTGDVKDIKDLTTAYSQFMKIAKIDEMIESQQTDVIRTVADLVDYLEKTGFDPKFYDNFERDQVDRTINDMKEHLRNLVYESTGLEQTLELISRKYQEDLKSVNFDEVTKKTSIEDLMQAAKDGNAAEIDQELDDDIMSEDELDENF